MQLSHVRYPFQPNPIKSIHHNPIQPIQSNPTNLTQSIQTQSNPTRSNPIKPIQPSPSNPTQSMQSMQSNPTQSNPTPSNPIQIQSNYAFWTKCGLTCACAYCMPIRCTCLVFATIPEQRVEAPIRA